MPRTSDSREKMVVSAAHLLRERGVAGTGFRAVVDHADAPRGSIGHHFPDGKRQLVAEAVEWAGARATEALEQAAREGGTADAARAMVAAYRQALIDSGYAAGCPIGMVAQEAAGDEALRDATRRVFTDWRAILVDKLRAEGRTPARAAALADVMIAGMEGALLVARVDRDPAALDHLLDAVVELLGAE